MVLFYHPQSVVVMFSVTSPHMYGVGQKSKLLYCGLYLRQLCTNLKKFSVRLLTEFAERCIH